MIDELDYLFELANKNHLFISMSSVLIFIKVGIILKRHQNQILQKVKS